MPTVKAARYEANALWGCVQATEVVRVFEMNSAGVAELDVGAFTEAGALVVELRGTTNELRERRTFRRSGNTLEMDVWFYADGQEVKHSMTLIRK